MPAPAATTSTNFNVTATVLASCAVNAADLGFGNYTANADSTANTAISVTCTSGTAYTITLDGGATMHDQTARAMSDGGSNTLSYQLYTTSGLSTVWGDGTGSTGTVGGTGDGTAQSATVYGKIPSGQYVVPASYSDLVTVTVTY